jgi:(2Fe-2S) ferredoxin
MRFQKHIFICTNQRAEGARKSCGEACGLDLVKEFKKEIKDAGLSDKIRAQRSGCLDACDQGPSLVIYPEGVFYGGVQKEDVAEIVREHIVNDRIVDRLRIDFDKTV